jgi:putative membrane protein
MASTFHDLAIATHLVGVILWIGGTATAAMVALAGAKAAGESRTAILTAARRAVLFIGTPGLLLTWIAGLAYLVPNFMDLYARAGWMHTKLTLLVGMTALTGVFTGRLRKAASGAKEPSVGLFAAVVLVLFVFAAVIAFLAELQPGA